MNLQSERKIVWIPDQAKLKNCGDRSGSIVWLKFENFLMCKQKYAADQMISNENFFFDLSSSERYTRFIQASLCKFQGLFKDFSRLSYSFQELKVYEKSRFTR